MHHPVYTSQSEDVPVKPLVVGVGENPVMPVLLVGVGEIGPVMPPGMGESKSPAGEDVPVNATRGRGRRGRPCMYAMQGR